MPELPEVEVVRRGLASSISGRQITGVRVLHPRPVRRHLTGPADFELQVTGRTFAEPRRRGKYLWLPFTDGDAILAHLGMSGQFRLADAEAPLAPNTRIIFAFADGEPGLRFVDQRMFGGLSVSPGGAELPPEIAHIGRDPFDPEFDLASRRDPVTPPQQCDQTVAAGSAAGVRNRQHLRRRSALGGSGALRAARPGRCRVLKPRGVIDAAAAVMRKALDNGGTSFDALYVNVNGSSGYFDRSLRGVRPRRASVSALRNIDPARTVHEPFVLSLSTLSTSSTRVQGEGRDCASSWIARLRERLSIKVGIS